MNPKRLAALLIPALISSLALAHGIAGLRPIQPGQPFNVASMRGLVRDAAGHYQRQAIDLNQSHDGSALAFLVADPISPHDLAEVKRFQDLLSQLPHTHGFLVLPPARSMTIDSMAGKLDQSGLTLPTIVDDRDIFPYVFRHDMKRTPRYELFDRSQTLVIENATHLKQRTIDGENIGQLMKRLDLGQPVAPLVVSFEEQAGYDPRE